MIEVVKAGIQTTIQSSPRTGLRHFGIPWAGAADGLSMALANRLCGNPWDAPVLEVTFGGVTFTFVEDCTFAVAGAMAPLLLDGRPVEAHRTHSAHRGQSLEIGVSKVGLRIYLAVAGGLAGQDLFGSVSTFIPASFGGYEGRPLQDGDQLELLTPGPTGAGLQTPSELIPHYHDTHVLRVCPSAEFSALTHESRKQLFERPFFAARQLDRMGIRLEGNPLQLRHGDEQVPSAAVHPGVIQCPAGGTPILLGADAQTTGGYPRILSVIGADLHRLGQIRPGDRVQLFYCSAGDAAVQARGVLAYYDNWIGSQWLYG